MPIPVADAVDETVALAQAKVAQARDLPRYLLSSALAGAFVGVAVVLLITVSAPLFLAQAPTTRLVQGAVFGVALTLVVFAGGELFTGNVAFLLTALYRGGVRLRDLALVWVASLVGNLLGSVALAALVHGGGTLGSAPGEALVAALVDAKNATTGPQLLWRAVLCNLLVCLGLWMAARTRSDAAKLAVLWWALLAFVGSGFEHSVANMTLFTLGVLEGSAGWLDLGRNLAWTVPGNVLGGGLLVGVAYAWLAGPPARPAARREAPEAVPQVTPAGTG